MLLSGAGQDWTGSTTLCFLIFYSGWSHGSDLELKVRWCGTGVYQVRADGAERPARSAPLQPQPRLQHGGPSHN